MWHQQPYVPVSVFYLTYLSSIRSGMTPAHSVQHSMYGRFMVDKAKPQQKKISWIKSRLQFSKRQIWQQSECLNLNSIQKRERHVTSCMLHVTSQHVAG